MLISVIICTRNRANQLRRVLDSASELIVPEPINWELIVVDNGSTDDTKAVCNLYQENLPIKYVFESSPGLSLARNKGVAAAQGEYICWTDDDVIIDPLWLQAYYQAFRKYPHSALFGGVIDPLTEIALPEWWKLNENTLDSVLAKLNLGNVERPLTLDKDLLPYGANFAVKTAEQRKWLYDLHLGVSPNQNRLGEETEVMRSILKTEEGVWVPGAIVSHVIPKERLSFKYLAKYFKSAGETWAYLSTSNKDNFMGKSFNLRSNFVPIWMLRSIFFNFILYTISRLTAGKAKSVIYWTSLNYSIGAAGYIIERYMIKN
ncbi:glycosyltransferase [Asticcacaulis sp. DW145]|uniref:glycosyltransferase n=1 Tax=Asticcacaulis sp. DW145 TaxID=3095608 RepID=UPI0030D54F72